MERRTFLRGALTLPVAATALLELGPASTPVASPAGPAPVSAPAAAATAAGAGRKRHRTWDVETLDRRLRSARS
jgi:hypothetical protein